MEKPEVEVKVEQEEEAAAAWPQNGVTTVKDKEFEDNFKDKLPDSQEYLAVLEAKLAKLQKKGSLVDDLRNRRQDEMKRFLANGNQVSSSNSDFTHENIDIPSNALLRRIAPEKQALTVEELLHLVKEDQLLEPEDSEEDSGQK